MRVCLDHLTESFTCLDGQNLTIYEETDSPMLFNSKLHGNQFQTLAGCNAPDFTYQIEKTVRQ